MNHFWLLTNKQRFTNQNSTQYLTYQRQPCSSLCIYLSSGKDLQLYEINVTRIGNTAYTNNNAALDKVLFQLVNNDVPYFSIKKYMSWVLL